MQQANLTRIVHFDLGDAHREQSVAQMQSWLPDLLALGLRLKQAHWNLRGPRFKSIHEELDEVVADVRASSDSLAERIVTLGGAADGRPEIVAQSANFEPMETGRMSVEAAIDGTCEDLAKVIRLGRHCIERLGEFDPVSEDLAIGIVQALEKHHWMFDSQRGA